MRFGGREMIFSEIYSGQGWRGDTIDPPDIKLLGGSRSDDISNKLSFPIMNLYIL